MTIAEYVSIVDAACRRRLGHPLQVTQHDVPTRMRSSLDCARLSLAGWTPSYTLEQSVADLFEYFINAQG